jgi:hypothetical protein
MKTVILIAALALFLGACNAVYPHKYSHGDCVKMKLDGREGMVVGSKKYSGILWVRLVSDTAITTDTFFGGEHEVGRSPYTKIMVREYELTGCDK